MSQPVIIWRKWDTDRKLTILRVDTAYTASFCEHLKARGLQFVLSEIAHEEWGMDRDEKRWGIITNEIAIHGLLGPDDILPGWEIPQPGC